MNVLMTSMPEMSAPSDDLPNMNLSCVASADTSKFDSLMTDVLLEPLTDVMGNGQTMDGDNSVSAALDKKTDQPGILSTDTIQAKALNNENLLFPKTSRLPNNSPLPPSNRVYAKSRSDFIKGGMEGVNEEGLPSKPGAGETLVQGKSGETPDLDAHTKGQGRVGAVPRIALETGLFGERALHFNDVNSKHPALFVSPTGGKVEGKSQKPELYPEYRTGLDFLKANNNAGGLHVRGAVRTTDGKDTAEQKDYEIIKLSTSSKLCATDALVRGKLIGLTELKVAGGIRNFSNENGFENHGDITKLDNADLISGANIIYGSHRTGNNPFSANVTRPSGFAEVLDNIIYVIKSSNKLDVSIEHDSLGKLNINLSMERGMLNVQINTSERMVRELIENNLQYIMDSLIGDGVSIGGFSVSLKDKRENSGDVFVGGTPVKELIKALDGDDKTRIVNIFV